MKAIFKTTCPSEWTLRGRDIPICRRFCRAHDLPSVDGPLRRGVLRRAGPVGRMVTTDRQGMPDFCPEPVEWRGRYRNRRGWHVVDSCDGHVDDKLVGVKRPP
jgi:hypothetical protein